MPVTMKRNPVEKLFPSDKAVNEWPNTNIFKPPKFDTDLQNYFYYTEVYKDWFQLK